MDEKILTKLTDFDRRMTKLETVIHGANGYGGLSNDIKTIKANQEEARKKQDEIKKLINRAIGAVGILMAIPTIMLIFQILNQSNG